MGKSQVSGSKFQVQNFGMRLFGELGTWNLKPETNIVRYAPCSMRPELARRTGFLRFNGGLGMILALRAVARYN
jgi:hypothetical protein